MTRHCLSYSPGPHRYEANPYGYDLPLIALYVGAYLFVGWNAIATRPNGLCL